VTTAGGVADRVRGPAGEGFAQVMVGVVDCRLQEAAEATRGQRSRPLGHEYPEHHRGRPPGLVRLPRRGRARKWTRWRRGSLRAKAKCSVVRGSERLAGSAHRLATRASTALVMASFAGT